MHSLNWFLGAAAVSAAAALSNSVMAAQMKEVSLLSATQKIRLVARVSSADVGHFSPILAARDVSLKVLSAPDNKVTLQYQCLSFMFNFQNTYATCSLGDKIISVDLRYDRVDVY